MYLGTSLYKQFIPNYYNLIIKYTSNTSSLVKMLGNNIKVKRQETHIKELKIRRWSSTFKREEGVLIVHRSLKYCLLYIYIYIYGFINLCLSWHRKIQVYFMILRFLPTSWIDGT